MNAATAPGAPAPPEASRAPSGRPEKLRLGDVLVQQKLIRVAFETLIERRRQALRDRFFA